MNRFNRSAAVLMTVCWMFLAAGWAFPADQPQVKDAPAPKTMLLIGNSFMYYNNSLHNHLRKLTQSKFPAEEKKFFFKSMTLSGSYLSDHALGAAGMISQYSHTKKKGPWELVVLQGQSREPYNPKKSAEFKTAVRQLDKMVRDAGSRTVLFMTWAYKDKPEMTQQLADAYTRTGNELQALVVPVGLAFARGRSNNPDMELHAADKRHPSLLGTYLAASVFFATLYGQSPEGASYTAGLSADEVKFAQTTAWQTVQSYFGR